MPGCVGLCALIAGFRYDFRCAVFLQETVEAVSASATAPTAESVEPTNPEPEDGGDEAVTGSETPSAGGAAAGPKKKNKRKGGKK